jgi:hypothetical protein
VLEDEVLIWEGVCAVDGVAPSSVLVLEISPLKHELGNHPVEVRPFVSKTIFT